MISLDCAEPSVYSTVRWYVKLKDICLNVSFLLTFSSFCSLNNSELFFKDNSELVVPTVVVF